MRDLRYRLATVLGLAGTVLVAVSDHLIGVPCDAERFIDIWGRD